MFAGLLTKVGVYAIIRTQTLLFPPDARPATLLLVLAGATMVIGVLGAIAQDDVKRILSFHIVSQIGYMVMGLGLFTVAGVAGAVFYIVHHIIVKTSLFLAGGLIEHAGGSSRLCRLGGMVRTAPVLAVLFLLPALSLAGIPPFSGFVGKLALVEAGVASERVRHRRASSLVVSLLTLFVDGQDLVRRLLEPGGPAVDRAATGSADEPLRRSAPHGRADRRPRHLRARRHRRRRTALRPERAHRTRSPRAEELHQRGARPMSLVPRLVLLVVIWVLAWGEITVVNVIVGAVLAAALSSPSHPRVTPRSPAPASGRSPSSASSATCSNSSSSRTCSSHARSSAGARGSTPA